MNRNMFKSIIKFFIIYFIIIVGFYFVGDEQIRFEEYFAEMPTANAALDEISEGTVIEQEFISRSDTIDKFTLYVATYARVNRGHVVVSLIDTAAQEKKADLIMEAGLLADNSFYESHLQTSLRQTKARH